MSFNTESLDIISRDEREAVLDEVSEGVVEDEVRLRLQLVQIWRLVEVVKEDLLDLVDELALIRIARDEENLRLFANGDINGSRVTGKAT